MLLYAWNSCSIAGMDISRSFVVVGREFAFTINYSHLKHFELTSTPDTVTSYSKALAQRLAAGHAVAKLLVDKMRSYHRERMNAL